LGGESKRLAKEGNSQELLNTAWSFATLGVKAPVFFKALEGESKRLAKEGKPQELSNTAWSLAALSLAGKSDMCHQLYNTAVQSPVNQFNSEGLIHLYQVQLCLKVEGDESRPLFPMSSEWQSRVNEVLSSASHTESRSHNEISSLFEEMGVKHEKRVSPPLPIEDGIEHRRFPRCRHGDPLD